jgi:hypothetical protein
MVKGIGMFDIISGKACVDEVEGTGTSVQHLARYTAVDEVQSNAVVYSLLGSKSRIASL